MVISDEKIAAAMLASGSAFQAAETLGGSPSTIYRRARSPKFQALYHSLQSDLLRATVAQFRDSVCDALAVQETIMRDEEINPAIRLQASQYLLGNILRVHKLVEESEKAANDCEEKTQAFAVAKSILEKK